MRVVVIIVMYLFGIVKLTALSPKTTRKIATVEVNITHVYVLRLVVEQVICTGTLIHESWVLTAAHCIQNPKNPDDVNVKSLADDLLVHSSLCLEQMYAGIDDTSKQKEAQIRKGKSVIIHDDYMPEKVSKYDFALVEAEQPFELNKKVGILELSDDPWPQGGEMYSRRCVAAGWGVDDIETVKVNKLKVISVTARHGEEGCKCFKAFHNRRLVCLDDRGLGICKGDSGGALVCERKVVGVAHYFYSKKSCSIGSGDTKLSCKDSTGAYMYLCPQLDWIHEYVRSVPKTPATCSSHPSIQISFMFLWSFFL